MGDLVLTMYVYCDTKFKVNTDFGLISLCVTHLSDVKGHRYLHTHFFQELRPFVSRSTSVEPSPRRRIGPVYQTTVIRNFSK